MDEIRQDKRGNSPDEKAKKGAIPADEINEASEESFPASDPPARTVVHGIGPPSKEEKAKRGP